MATAIYLRCRVLLDFAGNGDVNQMAKNSNQTQQATEPKRGRGRPPADPNADPAALALQKLQKTLDRTTTLICDGPATSVVARIARCARAGVPRATVEKALAAMSAALEDANEQVERVYAAPAAKAPVAQRVNLLG